PSGTLGYLFGELGRGRRFSQALRGAIAKGYPEPDPREDLSGMDVARKALILGRLLGFPGELKDIAVESLVPPGAERLTPEEFLARLEEYDAPWTRRLAQARRRGGALRYRAIVTGAALRARFDGRRAENGARDSGVWRFLEAVLPTAAREIVSYPEGNTPLLECPALARWTGLARLLLKHEGLNPTGSFKDRGM